MKAISTKILPCSATKPFRIKAHDCEGHSVIMSADESEFGMNDERTARMAAEKFKQKMNWKGDLVGGWTKEGWVFVFTTNY